jgi:hypothetical protein
MAYTISYFSSSKQNVRCVRRSFRKMREAKAQEHFRGHFALLEDVKSMTL